MEQPIKLNVQGERQLKYCACEYFAGKINLVLYCPNCRSQWPRGLRRGTVAARSKAWNCGRSLAGITDSNPAGGIDVCLLWVLCIVRLRSLRRADHASRDVLPSVCVSECDREASTMRRSWPTTCCCAVEKNCTYYEYFGRKLCFLKK